MHEKGSIFPYKLVIMNIVIIERIEAVKQERNTIIRINEKKSGKNVDIPMRVKDATAEQIAIKRAEQTSKLLEMVSDYRLELLI